MDGDENVSGMTVRPAAKALVGEAAGAGDRKGFRRNVLSASSAAALLAVALAGGFLQPAAGVLPFC